MSKKTRPDKSSKYKKRTAKGVGMIFDPTPNADGKTAEEIYNERLDKNIKMKLLHNGIFTNKVVLSKAEETRAEESDAIKAWRERRRW